MIKTFKDSNTEDLFSGEHVSRFPADVQSRARRKLFAIDAAMRIEDLRMPPGNHLHSLKGNRKGQYAIRVNDQWRICFRFADGIAEDVEMCDYH